jgi:sugar lactone lactonase YvrE
MNREVTASNVEFRATPQRLSLGEGPLWHPAWQELLVVDVPRGEIHRFDPDLLLKGSIVTGRPTSAVTWQEDGSILCFHDRGAISRVADADAMPANFLTISDEAGGMFNDVIADPRGRILCGALPIGSRPGRLYCIDADRSYRILLDDLLEPNGMAFTCDGRVLYFADSVGQVIWRMSYDIESGSIGRRTAFWRSSGAELPDGLTVDAADHVVCAIWSGGCVVRFTPSGEIVGRMRLPAKRMTSVAYGGPLLDMLYATSALQDGADGAGDEAAGAVFRIPGSGRGRPEWPSRVAF